MHPRISLPVLIGQRASTRNILGVVALLASPIGIAQQAGVRVAELQIAHAITMPMSASQVDRVLQEASRLLRIRDTATDIECHVEFRRKATLMPLPTNQLPAAIQSKADMESLANLPGDVKVVGQINWCGEPGIFIGCAADHPGVMAVTPLDDDASEGILWAHEYGHNRGLPHSPNGLPRRLMLPYIGPDHREVTSPECSSIAAPRLFGLKHDAKREMLFRPFPEIAPAAMPALPPIVSLLRRHWVHGLPFAEVSAYGANAVPAALAMLETLADRPFWSNAVLAVGVLGNSEHVRTLVAFFQRGEGALTPSESRAKSAVLVAVGFIQSRNPSQAAQAFLLSNSNPNAVTVAWTPAGQQDKQIASRSVARMAAVGLAYSGTAVAAARLNDIQQSIERGAFSLNTGVGEPVGLIEELRGIRSRVSASGLRNFMIERR